MPGNAMEEIETDQDVQTPLQFEIEQPEEYAQYLLHAKAEVLAILRSLNQRRALISAYFDEGRTFLLTSLLAIDGDNLILELGRDDEVNRQVLAADHIVLTATVDKVKVQFTLPRLVATRYGGRPAFGAVLPDKVLRLQRREYFRLSTPVARPVKFSSSIKRPDRSVMTIEASLLDISGGGVGLMATPALAALLPRGCVLADCKMALPDEGLLVANLCVRNKYEVTTRTGSRYVRIGCEFIALPGARMSMVQRYITRVERERKARLSGMA